MKNKLNYSALLFAVVLIMSSCYNYTFMVGDGPQTGALITGKNHYFIGGLAKGQQTIILDESLKFLSKEYLEQASAFLRQMCDKLDMQIVLVSHKENLQFSADKVITIDKQRGKSLIV